jgi:RHS repeat-associated protein
MKISKDNDTIAAVAFEVDALGRRIEKVDAIVGTTTRYYYDDQRVAVQTLVSGGVETDDRYFVFGGTIDEVLVMRNLTGTPADIYCAHDHLYSPVALFAANGTTAERYEGACPEYNRGDVYGQVQFLTSNFYPLPSSQHANPYTFTGRELDTLDNNTLHLMYYRARYYDPDTGRFMQRDPLGVNPAGRKLNSFKPRQQYADGMNVYEYVASIPTILSDPYGLMWVQPTPCDMIRSRIQNEAAAIVIAGALLMGPGAVYDTYPVHKNDWPHQHCVWNCRMARKGRDAEGASAIKEAIDEAIADLRDELIDSGCYEGASDFLKINLEGPACSASQESDFRDNATGRDMCGDRCDKRSCEQCCAENGVPSGTPEGPGTNRPYGSRCKFPELLQKP